MNIISTAIWWTGAAVWCLCAPIGFTIFTLWLFNTFIDYLLRSRGLASSFLKFHETQLKEEAKKRRIAG